LKDRTKNRLWWISREY